VTRCGEDVATGPPTPGASDIAGELFAEYNESSGWFADVVESIGLVTEGCVRLGDVVA